MTQGDRLQFEGKTAMSFRVSWDTPEQTRVIVEFYEPITWTAFHESIAQAHALITSVPHPVDLIIWDKVGLPPGSALSQFRSAFQTQPVNTGRVFIVSKQTPIIMRFMGQLATVMQKLFPSKSKILFVSSLDEARKLAVPRPSPAA